MLYCLCAFIGKRLRRSYQRCFSSGVMFFRRVCALLTKSLLYAFILLPHMYGLLIHRYRGPPSLTREGLGVLRKTLCRAVAVWSYQTNDTFNVGHKTKRYIFVPKTGVVKPKGIFLSKNMLI